MSPGQVEQGASISNVLASGVADGADRLDAELLLCHSLGVERAHLHAHPERELAEAELAHFRNLLARRREGVPVAYLLGRKAFWSLSLKVDERCLVPRPETELLVQWALELPLPQDARVGDWGTGSGAIALALAAERPGWQVLATDIDPGVLELARENGHQLGADNVRWQVSDWGAQLDGERFHLVVSNPPYVAEGDPLLEELRSEPGVALVSGPGGLEALESVVAASADRLLSGGYLLLEHGCDQGGQVRELLRKAGFGGVSTRRDLAGLERATGGVAGDG